MADIKEAIRRMIYQYVVEGADKVVASQAAVTASTMTTDKAALSLEKSFGNLERRYVATVRQQQDYQKAQERINAAVAQNPALQERANVVLAALNEQYNKGTVAQKAFATATSGVQGQLLALSAGAGPVGVFLSSLGPWGFAASAGLGAVTGIFDRLVAGAERIGDKSIELRKFSEVTGLTVTQIKGLTQAGGLMGIKSEEIESSLEKFTIGLNDARKGTGSLYEQIQAINPALAEQLAVAPNAARAWDILAKAIQGATDASQRNALARAAFGKGGIETGLVAIESATKGGIDNLAKGSALTKEWVDETARLRAENVQLEKSIKNTMDAAYALPILQRQNEFLKLQKDITTEFLKMDKVPLAIAVLAAAGGPLGNLAAGVVQLGNVAAQPRTSSVSDDEKRNALLNASKAATLDPAALESWNKLEDAMGRVVVQSDQVAQSLKQQQDAAAKAANEEKARVGYLGAAATDQERLNAKTLELNALLINNTISQETYNRVLGAAQYTADATLRGLRDQGELIRASSSDERARIQAAQTYRDIVKTTGDTQKAAAIASQQLSNANEQRWREEEKAAEDAVKAIKTASDAWAAYERGVISWSVAHDEAVKSVQATAQATEDAGVAMAVLREEAFWAAKELMKFVPFFNTATDFINTAKLYQSNQGGVSQFNPTGYTSTTTSPAINAAKTLYGEGNYTTFIGPGGLVMTRPTQQWIDQQNQATIDRRIANTPTPEVIASNYVNSSLAQRGVEETINGLLRGALGKLSGDIPSGYLTQLNPLLSPETRTATIEREIAKLREEPMSIAREALIQNLTQSLDDLKGSVDNLSDVFSPFYSSDPRSSKLGFRTFAGGGIMTADGMLPLRQYQGGGMATSPQVAVFGEGSTPEAYVPVPSGRIPVELKMPANSNARPIQVNITVQGNADAGTVQALKQTAFQSAQQLRRVSRG